MAPSPPRLRIISIGGNAVSAFLSWRLQATNACDVTLVWKSGYEAVAQYGISFKSKLFGNERFKPRHVVRAPEDASSREAAFDYVLLCVKALPDVYDLAAVIESVVTPQHTCILVNTTNTLGVEQHLEQRFPTNVVLSLVSGAEIFQLAPSEFEHTGTTEVWVGPANKNPAIPGTIQNDMAEALAMTLSTGQVDCKVSTNIRQQQYERMIGPIAFHPASVLFETPSHTQLIEKVGVRQMVNDVMDELLRIATAQECAFPPDFKETTMSAMLVPTENQSTMYQDFVAKRPMEVETYLGSPIQISIETGIPVPRIETLYSLLHHVNIVNQTKQPPTPQPTSPVVTQPPARISSAPPPRHPTNGPNGHHMGPPMNGRGGRIPSMGMPGPPSSRRGPPPNGFPRGGPNGYLPRGPNQMVRRPSFEENNLDDFSHVVLYEDIPEGDVAAAYEGMPNGVNGGGEFALRERELMLRQKELALREQEMRMKRGPPRRGPPRRQFEDEDEDDYFDPMESRRPAMPEIDTDNFDMMSVTSRRNRKAPSVSQLRQNPEHGMRASSSFARPFPGRNRTSARIMQEIPGMHDSLMDNPMMGYSSNRYANVDRKEMQDESRANSLTAGRLQELNQNGFPPPPPSRRASQSPGNPFSPMSGRNVGRPSPPNDGYPTPRNGRPSPPGLMPAPVPRYPPGQGNAVAPQQVEQHVGVSKPFPPPKGPSNVRSLTGSASASAGSGDSGASAHIDSEPSAHSSQSSLGPRHALGVH